MRPLAKFAFAALVAGSAIGFGSSANAAVGVTIGVGPFTGSYYDYGRPCDYYRGYGYPAPARCYNDYYGYYGPGVYIDSGFVFRDRVTYGRWRYRNDYRHWRRHAHH
jgi:hypothetical protein